ncbi:hypothetical protein CI109_106724 [Kwoniella shandongensis]|uniref:Copper transport protein n=1 Tax=Kwoniella shandongensis TaxID=1734106 RepID=A0A5M6C851_9TREE|nr:uncharacterized protein CI109_001020 [Kwoniella shandongensis]KAA5530840.1 hypothetical protein CI109_001020 [Kwoniella shandongensis]
MDMGGSASSAPSHACKISMLWNWNTVDTCFLSSTWHVRSKGMFAGSVIGVFCLTIAIELVRRIGREYDRRLILASKINLSAQGSLPVVNKDSTVQIASYAQVFTPSWLQQILRGMVYGSQFTAAFLVMLLGMYYNGYILFAIFLGQTIGYIVFGRDTCSTSAPFEHSVSGNCC